MEGERLDTTERVQRYRSANRPHAAMDDRTPAASIKDRPVDSVKSDDAARVLSIISAECSELDARKITPADRAAVAEFVAQHGPPTQAQVRAGIAATLVRAQGKRINGIRYFFSEILKARVLPDASGYAEHCVARLKRERYGCTVNCTADGTP